MSKHPMVLVLGSTNFVVTINGRKLHFWHRRDEIRMAARKRKQRRGWS